MSVDGTGISTVVSKEEARRLTVQIVAAHVSHNSVATSDLSGLIEQVYKALNGLGQPSEPVAVRPEPAVSVKKSITPDYLICLEDGKKLKMLKRHLQSAYNMTPDEYRSRWGLSADYPMVAPNYAKQRSALAKTIGLGTKSRVPVPAPQPAASKGRRGRKPAGA